MTTQLTTASGKPLDAEQTKALRNAFENAFTMPTTWWGRLTEWRAPARELRALRIAHVVLAETLDRERLQAQFDGQNWMTRLAVEKDLVAGLRARVVELEAPMKKPRRSGAKIKAT